MSDDAYAKAASAEQRLQRPIRTDRTGNPRTLVRAVIGERIDYAPPNLAIISCHLSLTFEDGAGFSVPAAWLRDVLERDAAGYK